MSDPKLISPLLDGYIMGSPISEHDGVVCCPAMKENSDNKYIVKIISIPASQNQLDAFLLTGAYKDPADAMDYFKDQADGVVKEAELLQKLSKLDGYLPYDSWQVEPMDNNQLGYQIYLISSYKRSLEKFMSRNSMTHLGAVNLGLDICAALAIARRAGHIYADLKPANIFISEGKEYRIGDLGFLDTSALKYTSLPAKYCSSYTAPELRDAMCTVNMTADTYALGMILYQIYNNGVLPVVDPEDDQPLPAPANADYEIAEIILKACAPSPKDRYSDPMEMGQALVAYMQRNRVNNTPITPPAAVPEIIEDEPILEKNGAVYDESAPSEEDAADVAVETVSEETGAMLEQAESLISEEPVEEEIPEETIPEIPAEEVPESSEVDAPEKPAEVQPEAPADAEALVIPEFETNAKDDAPADDFAELSFKDVRISEPQETAPQNDDEDMDFREFLNLPEEPKQAEVPQEAPKPKKKNTNKKKGKKKKKKKKAKGILITIVLLLILSLVGAGAFYYYDNYYLQTINSISVEGEGDEMTVILDTQTDNSLLTILITDTYGNTTKSAVTDNKATFGDLLPGTLYKIRVEISGFHALHPKGVASHGYTTDSQTKIVSFTAKTGSEDGSVVLNFAVEGIKAENWIVTYSAEDEEAKTQEFSGRMTTVTGLTVDKVYTFTLNPVDELVLVGENSIQFTASKIITAENLQVTEYSESKLAVSWVAPADTTIDSWTVRCFSEAGYDKSLTTTETSAAFTDIDPTKAYTVEVLAAGMTNPASINVTADPYHVSNIKVDSTDASKLTVTWDNEGEAPADGWILKYSVDGSTNLGVAMCDGNSAVIQPRVPGAKYRISVLAANGNTVFGGNLDYACPNASVFSAEDMLISTEDISNKLNVNMLVTPDTANWTRKDISADELTTIFKSGQKASMLLFLNTNFYIRDLDVTVMYVIRDANGNVLPNYISQVKTNWSEMWYEDDYQFCELDIPTIPSEPGAYTLYLYFNNAAVTTVQFTVTE